MRRVGDALTSANLTELRRLGAAWYFGWIDRSYSLALMANTLHDLGFKGLRARGLKESIAAIAGSVTVMHEGH